MSDQYQGFPHRGWKCCKGGMREEKGKEQVDCKESHSEVKGPKPFSCALKVLFSSALFILLFFPRALVLVPNKGLLYIFHAFVESSDSSADWRVLFFTFFF